MNPSVLDRLTIEESRPAVIEDIFHVHMAGTVPGGVRQGGRLPGVGPPVMHGQCRGRVLHCYTWCHQYVVSGSSVQLPLLPSLPRISRE